MRTSNYSVIDRKINFVEVTNLTGNENVDTFHFDFDSEWDVFNAKYLVLIVGTKSYIDELDENNDVILRPVAYDRDDVTFGVYGINGEENAPVAQLSSNVVWLETIPSIWGQIKDVDGLPNKTVWEVYTEEILGLLAQGKIQVEECEDILTQIQLIQTALNGLAETVSAYATAVATMKSQIEASLVEINTKITAFDSNFEAKLSAFNSNATSKTSAFDENAAAKLYAFNSNASSKTSDFNSNASSKTETFNTNYNEKLDAVNTAGSTQVSAVNSVGSTQVGNVETAGTTQVGLVNSAGTTAVGNVEDAEDEAIQHIQEEASSYNARITDLELLKSNLNKVTTEKATYHNIIDSLNAKIEDIIVCGNTYQYSTTGKNKFNVGTSTSDYSNSRVSSVSDGIVSMPIVSGGQTFTYRTQNFEGNKSYAFSCVASIVGSRFFIRLRNNTDDGWLTDSDASISGWTYNSVYYGWYKESANKENKATATIPECLYWQVGIGFATTSSTQGTTQTITDIMVAEGTNTDYEKYTGGQASPNSDYRQDIKVVTGDVTANATGKNLINIPDGTSTRFDDTTNNPSHITITNNIIHDVSEFKSESTLTEFGNSYLLNNALRNAMYPTSFTNNSPINLPAGTYTLIYKYISGSTNAGVVGNNQRSLQVRKYSNTAEIGRIYYLQNADKSFTFTLTEETKVNISYCMYSTSKGFKSDIKFQVQLVRGSVADYDIEPYVGQSQLLSLGDKELAEIGDYQDKLFKAIVGNKVYDSLTAEQKATLTYGKNYKYKIIGKAIYDGSETGWGYQNSRFTKQISDILVQTWATRSTIIISNYFLGGVTAFRDGIPANKICKVIDTAVPTQIGINYPEITTIAEFKEWLTTHNLIVYYVLATPVFEEITDETLSAQLDALYDLITHKNITNIFTTTDDLEPELEVSYLKDDRVAYESRLTALENAFVSLGANV